MQRARSRATSPNFIFGADDIVVVLGQDGLVANTLKYLDGQHVIGVNPDPQALGRRAAAVRGRRISPRCMPEEIAAAAAAEDGDHGQGCAQHRPGALCRQRPLHRPDAAMSRRAISSAVGEREERQSSSGIIVSTGLGSTGWLKSIYAGWAGAAAQPLGVEPPAGALDAPSPGTPTSCTISCASRSRAAPPAASLVAGRIAAGARGDHRLGDGRERRDLQRRHRGRFPRIQHRHQGDDRVAERQGMLVA